MRKQYFIRTQLICPNLPKLTHLTELLHRNPLWTLLRLFFFLIPRIGGGCKEQISGQPCPVVWEEICGRDGLLHSFSFFISLIQSVISFAAASHITFIPSSLV